MDGVDLVQHTEAVLEQMQDEAAGRDHDRNMITNEANSGQMHDDDDIDSVELVLDLIEKLNLKDDEKRRVIDQM